jgi:hypothetical protein
MPTWWPGSAVKLATSPRSQRTLQTATTQRWTPEALLRALITTEVTGATPPTWPRLKGGRARGA